MSRLIQTGKNSTVPAVDQPIPSVGNRDINSIMTTTIRWAIAADIVWPCTSSIKLARGRGWAVQSFRRRLGTVHFLPTQHKIHRGRPSGGLLIKGGCSRLEKGKLGAGLSKARFFAQIFSTSRGGRQFCLGEEANSRGNHQGRSASNSINPCAGRRRSSKLQGRRSRRRTRGDRWFRRRSPSGPVPVLIPEGLSVQRPLALAGCRCTGRAGRDLRNDGGEGSTFC